jgi:hypothetical protein
METKCDQETAEGKEKAEEVVEGIEQTDQMIDSLIDFITNGDKNALSNFDKNMKAKKGKGGKKKGEEIDTKKYLAKQGTVANKDEALEREMQRRIKTKKNSKIKE